MQNYENEKISKGEKDSKEGRERKRVVIHSARECVYDKKELGAIKD